MEKYDVIVIGSGTAGYTVAKKCRESGLTVAVVEKDVLGGTCALHGCQPKKFFVVQAEMLRLAEHLQGKGVVTSPQLDWGRIEAFKREFTAAVPGGTEAFMAKIGATVHRGTARFAGPGRVVVGTVDLQADAVVLATGATPRIPAIPGIELALTSDDFLDQKQLPASVLFIGGGYISFEFAHVAAALGAKATILNKSSRVLKQFDAELVDAAVEASRDAGIAVCVEQDPVELTRTADGVRVRCASGEEFAAAAVYLGAGRVPNLGELNLEVLGVDADPRGLAVDSAMRVAGQAGLYAVGDCARTPALAPVADREALVAAARIAGEPLTMDYRTVPSVCFTQPALGAVGLTETEAQARGMAFTVRRGDTARWANLRRLGAKHGKYKLLVDPEGQILGAHLLGHEAGDIINLFALAMKGGLPASIFKEMMWAYPTLTSDTKYMV
jgi:glutathione reductase (NADPH)